MHLFDSIHESLSGVATRFFFLTVHWPGEFNGPTSFVNWVPYSLSLDIDRMRCHSIEARVLLSISVATLTSAALNLTSTTRDRVLDVETAGAVSIGATSNFE